MLEEELEVMARRVALRLRVTLLLSEIHERIISQAAVQTEMRKIDDEFGTTFSKDFWCETVAGRVFLHPHGQRIPQRAT